MKKHDFQILTKKQQANILGGRQLCAGYVGSNGVTVVEDGGGYYLTLWGADAPEVTITRREATNICNTVNSGSGSGSGGSGGSGGNGGSGGAGGYN